MTMKGMLPRTLGFVALGVVFAGCSTASHSTELGQAYYRDNQYASAADAFTDAIVADPTSAAAWNNRGVARLRLGDLNRAIADLNRALELAPRDADIYYNRGNALVAAGQYQDAVADYTRAAQINPRFSKAIFNRGAAYAMLGQHDAARNDWSLAISLEPDPWARAAMQRSAGLDAAPVTVSMVTRDVPRSNVASAPAPGTGAATVPIARTPSSLPAAPPVPPAGSPQVLLAPVQPSASPESLDARALAARAITREIDGDHAGALQDLRAAVTLEPDASRRVSIARLMRLLETRQ
jgi:tetratricopeptide (TPR) repeat protein